MSTKTKEIIKDDTYISTRHSYMVSDWKIDRLQLIDDVLWGKGNDGLWMDLVKKLFIDRYHDRFIRPIELMLRHDTSQGEGFSIMSLQCILIECIESFYQGKVFNHWKSRSNQHPFVYKDSMKLFKSFLTGHEPFKSYFNEKNATGFYENIRCGLLHEGATKKTSLIQNFSAKRSIIEKFDNDEKNMSVIRQYFFGALKEVMVNYTEDLITSKELKMNFIRKIDDISGIKRRFYFAYGSNMKPMRLLDRIGKYHYSRRAYLDGYEFTYNKISQDGTAKANIEKNEKSKVIGVLYEIDKDDVEQIDRFEGVATKSPYERIKVEIDGIPSVITYISTHIDNDLPPSSDYVQLIVDGANYWKFDDVDESYIRSFIDRKLLN